MSSEKIWTIQKKCKLNSEKMEERKLNGEKI
jgi:hypothetical protein